MFSQSILILTYHSLDESLSVVSTSPSIFKKQMKYLWEGGYKTLSLAEVINLIRKREPFPEKTFVITFDDGYKNVYTEALPVMQRYGFTGTVFLITDYCGKFNNWPTQPRSIKCLPLLSWSEIDEMRKHGFEFEAHTLTHPDLTRIPIQWAEREIVQSKEEIENRLSAGIKTFAYPYGRYNSKIREIVRNHFEGACCSDKLGKLETDCDPHDLRRIDMYYLRDEKLFKILSTPKLDWYLQFRQVFRELKKICM